MTVLSHVILRYLQKSKKICFVVPVKMVRYGVQQMSSSEKGAVSQKNLSVESRIRNGSWYSKFQFSNLSRRETGI